MYARRAQASAAHMEMMTNEMYAVTKKTEQETVSMRVITSVTLFFLPATFIAVRALHTAPRRLALSGPQTFISTDVYDFKDGKHDIQIRVLRIYLAIALPLTALTFLAWYIMYRVAKKSYSFASPPGHGVRHPDPA